LVFRQACVLDTNVCIDLFQGGITEAALALPIHWMLPDLIYNEMHTPAELVEAFNAVTVCSLGGAQVLRLHALRQDKQLRRLTVNDLSAFVLAEEKGAILATNEKDLRKLAEAHDVECHGILWVLDMLVSLGRIETMEAADALRRILANGSWLPKDECNRRMARWGRA
jgi:predicted nucleic acid-binding protein